MFTLLSFVTSIKDYVEIVHKLVETNATPDFQINTYSDFGAILTYIVLTIREIVTSFFTLKWLQNITAIPLVIPDIASSMLSEISVLDGYFHNSFTFLETPLSYGTKNILFYSLEKFMIGFINSAFLCLPTSTAHIITLRRFVMQGLEAGYFAGLGTLMGNMVWIGSIVFGLRFIVIPWLSFDILRYGLGFLLLVKYMWDSYSERRTVLEDLSKSKIFLLNFLLAFTEQATIYPFISNLSIGSEASFLETFPTSSFSEYSIVHFAYLGGLTLGGLTLLQLTCWFWENPAFNIYMWAISSLKLTSTLSQKFVNVIFLYLTMFFAISNVSYFGLDYTLTNPLGFVHEDRLLEQKNLIETAFLTSKASDRNTRRNRGRHGRRERWKRRVRRYRTFDVSLYDQGVFDLFTIEDLNYGFDRFWLRRKIRNHRVRFRFFPGPWMRSFKKQLARPRLESFMGPRIEFFRILFEQAYHPEFHEFKTKKLTPQKQRAEGSSTSNASLLAFKTQVPTHFVSFYSEKNEKLPIKNLFKEYSALRKFVRKLKTRTNIGEILFDVENKNAPSNTSSNLKTSATTKSIHSKRWKQMFSKLSHDTNRFGFASTPQEKEFKDVYKSFSNPSSNLTNVHNYFINASENQINQKTSSILTSKENSEKLLLRKDRQLLRYKTLLTASTKPNEEKSFSIALENSTTNLYKSFILLHPLQFYIQKEKAFQKKMKFYGASLFRNFGIENNAPYYRIMMKKFFYYYKPTLRWERTMRTATMRKARRKGPRTPRKLNVTKETLMLAQNASSLEFEPNQKSRKEGNSIQPFEQTKPKRFDEAIESNEMIMAKTKVQKPTHFYSLVSKRATRYRYQIYKDVLQHWYYSPFNRLLLKVDVDAFIRRQPQHHFMTKKEENLLHLKRFLLADYYNTLRWYNYMEHYNTMKKTIGKTKSFANRSYNQQFFGTFKKIRHLFAITPALNENNVLKFDQPLFNEYQNTDKTMNKNQSFYTSTMIHEELLADQDIYSPIEIRKTLPEDLTNQSTTVLKKYLERAEPIRQEYLKKLIEEQNYEELTSFLFKGKKTRGESATTNQNTFLNQEKNHLFDSKEKTLEKQNLQNFFNEHLLNFEETNRFLWLSLMKKCRNTLYNQEALKYYVNARVEKLEKQKRRQEKFFNNRLNNLKNWVSVQKQPVGKQNIGSSQTQSNLAGLTSSLQKSIKEGLYYELTSSSSTKKLEKSNLRNNRPKILLNLPLNSSPNSTRFSSNLKSRLNQRTKTRAFEIIQAEKNLRTKFMSVKEVSNKTQNQSLATHLNPSLISKLFDRTILPFKFVSNAISEKLNGAEDTSRSLFKPVRALWNWLRLPKEKNLNDWKKREIVFSTRKKIRRKIYRVLDQKKQFTRISNLTEIERLNQSNNLGLSRQKEDTFDRYTTKRQKKTWKIYEDKSFELRTNQNSNASNLAQNDSVRRNKNLFSEIFEKNFKRKRTRSRRYRRFKGRGPIKKHTLAEKLKRQFKLLKRYGQKQEGQDKKMEIFQMITKRKYEPNSSFDLRELKQRRTRQTKHRFWKKHKRQKYLQLKRKQRKRRRYAISKLRVLNKEFKHIKSRVQLKKWWWQNFLTNFMSETNAFWDLEKNKRIQQELETLSISDILKRDEIFDSQSKGFLQIGDKDFKPLALPQALRLRNHLNETGNLNFNRNLSENKNLHSAEFESPNRELFSASGPQTDTNDPKSEKSNIVSNVTTNLFTTQENTRINLTENLETKKLTGLNPIPFYAGWDENSRQFIVTNRLLSRQEAGYVLNLKNLDSRTSLLPKTLQKLHLDSKTSKLNFTKAPLEGMNAATTLYWQIPFTTYDPDQFFALGMDGFSPLGWRFFDFKHSKQTTKPILIQNMIARDQKRNSSLLSYNMQLKMFDLHSTTRFLASNSSVSSNDNKTSKNQARKIQKRQKRVKKHPRAPVWFPSGPLANQVLPVHYIYVFYKRARLPRDRYIARRFRKTDDSKAFFIQKNFTKMLDFTLRKRVKPIRKYHRKRILNKNQENNLILRRRPFKSFKNEAIRFRPLFKTIVASPSEMLNSSLLKTKQRKKTTSTKQTSENLRIRQLRRRIQRQVLRPIARYKPRSGGFVWPGDYLRLETIKASTLKISGTKDKAGSQSGLSIRKKKRRNIQEWQIQPKNYLLQKHNLKVLKKRLQKSQNSVDFFQNFKKSN
jgi:hypothetical protein